MTTKKMESENENVDATEIAKFESMASRWWDKEGDFKPLHEINPLRVDFINERSPVAGKALLDVGCGGGILTESMQQLGASVTGIDMGHAPLAVAKLHARESGIHVEYRQSTVEQVAEAEPESRDVVTCLEMLEHVPDPGSVIEACAAVTKPGGDLYFSTINRNPKSFLFAIVGAEYVLRMLPRGTHEYRKFIRPSELAGWIREANLELKEITGMTFNPLSKEYRLNQKDVDVNYLVHARKPA